MLNEATQRFIGEHRADDVRRLALCAGRPPDVDMPLALSQIAAWQTARRKLPSWAATEGLVYPPHLSMEQCSSEQTALYKARLTRRLLGGQRGEAMADLTGGFGVDFAFLAPLFSRAVYVERQPALCDMARHNLPRLSLPQAEVVQADAEQWLLSAGPLTMIYADPARRDSHGQKTFAIADCTPDVLRLRDTLLARARWVMLKLSPMLDWHKAVGDMGQAVAEVHIVATANECKELLLVLSAQNTAAPTVYCANDEQLFTFAAGAETPSATTAWAAPPPPLSSAFLFEPNAAIMKAGCFAELSAHYGVTPVAPNSHLFLSSHPLPTFPGRQFRMNAVTTLNKKQLRQVLAGISRANIAVRNFPLSAQQLRQRLRLADGGDNYLLGTTLASGDHVLLVCTK